MEKGDQHPACGRSLNEIASERHRIPACPSDELADRAHAIQPIRYAGKPHSCIALRFDGQLYAYLNQCIHMPRMLNCERDTVFDDRQALLRCSMHGSVYQPKTGGSITTMCHGERLTAIRLREIDGCIHLVDKRVMPDTKGGA